MTTGCRGQPASYASYAFIDKAGQVRIRLQPSEYAESFSEGLAPVYHGGWWGYIDLSGKWVIAPQFAEARDFSEALAVVTKQPLLEGSKGRKYGFIDRTGKFIIAPQFGYASSFSDGVAVVCTGPCDPWLAGCPSYGFINKAGDYVIGPQQQWSGVRSFSEGRAWAYEPSTLVGGRLVDYNQPTTRLIDPTGKFVSDARFLWGMPFSDGLAATDRGYVNRQGEIVIPYFGPYNSFADGWVAITESGRTAYIDTTGKPVLRPDCCQRAESFSEGLAAAFDGDCKGENCWGYIDKAGKFVIRPQFTTTPGPFHDGLALVCFGCWDE